MAERRAPRAAIRRWPRAVLALGLTLPVLAAAQATATRPAAPAAGQSTTEKFTVAGVPVILRRNAANDVVAAHLYLLGGARQVTAENAGIEPLLLQASEAGTRRYSKDALRQTMANLGSEIAVGADEDWSVFGLSTLREAFDSTWAVFADRLMQPALDSAEVERVREQFLSGVRQRRDSPDALVNWLADSLTWSGHPYATPVVGTQASLSRLTVADLRRYLAEQMVTSRMLLVIVGNVERSRVERLVTATLGRLPAGSYRWTLPEPPPPRPAAVAAESRPLPTNYILGYYPGPAASNPDYAALRVATAVLSGRLFNEIRARRNLTYAVNAPFVDRALSAGGLYVTTAYPDTTLALMRREVENIKRGTIEPEALEQLVQQFITEFFLDNETNAAQAHFLARAELYRGDYRLAERFVDELRGVTPQDVRRVAQTYMKGMRFAYVGDPAKANLRRLEAW